MYIPQSFKEERLDILHSFIRANPLGMLISNGTDGPLAASIPMLLVEGQMERGTIQLHLARANPQWQNIDGQNVLLVFQGTNAYVSPSWYPTKEKTGMVVPTWNYAMVQVRGIAKVVDDAKWLKRQITALTNQQELAHANPWKVSDAPEDFIDAQIRAIIGIEIEIVHIEGKWKVSQNRVVEDRKGVAENLAEQNPEMSQLVKDYGGV